MTIETILNEIKKARLNKDFKRECYLVMTLENDYQMKKEDILTKLTTIMSI